MALDALTIQYITGVSSFNVQPGYFYRVNASAGNVTAQLPLASSLDGSAWCIISKVDASANTVTITPTSPDEINQTTGNVATTRQVWPGTPAAGNLIVSAAGQSGTDPYGNAYPEGLMVTEGVVTAPAAAGALDGHVINVAGAGGGLFVYSADPGPLNTDPYFYSGISTWTAAGGSTTISYTTANAYLSPGCLLITPDGSSGTPRASQVTTATAGTVYGFSCLVLCPAGWHAAGDGFRIVVNWLNSSGSTISTSTGSTVPLPAGTQTQVSLVATAPATTASAQVFVEGVNTPSSSTLFYVQQAVMGLNGLLTAAVTGAAGTDMFGNEYLSGVAAYAAATASQVSSSNVDFYTGSLTAGWTEETWHTISGTLSNGWTGTINVQFLPIGQGLVAIDFKLVPGTVVDGTVIWTLGSLYQPATFKRIAAGCDAIKVSPVDGTTFESPTLYIGASGELQCYGVGTATTYFEGSGVYAVGF